jgi:hypothetical protein
MVKIIGHEIYTLNICMENNITIADLNLLKNIIDLASRRGAFQAGEMKQIGEVYEKLAQFLDAVIAQASQNEPADDQQQEETTVAPPEGESK